MSTNDSRIKNWSTTPGSNTSAPPFGAPEGMAPSTVNDIMRQQMSDHRYQWEDAAWFTWGDTVSRASASTFKIAADVTTRYIAQRRIKVFDAATYYATIVSSSYSAPDTTITLSMDSGSLTASLSAVALSIIEPINSPIPETSTANDAYPCLGRLTLTSGTAVTTADVTGATNIYFTPFGGNSIALYDGSANWALFNFTELTLGVAATTNTMYDVFAYNNAGVVALEATAWTNDTTRATALTTQNGVLVKTGATTRRYLGSYRTTGSSGQTEDSFLKRYLWNYYNRVLRPLFVIDTTNTWTYSTAAWRQTNNSTANQVDMVIGVSEDAVIATVKGKFQTSGATARIAYSGVGIDSTTATSCQISESIATNNAIIFSPTFAQYIGYISAGRHYLAWLEYGGGADTQTWHGDNGTAAGLSQTGLFAYLKG